MSGTSTLWGSFKGLGIAICGVYVSFANCAQAQITPDGTLLNNSRVRTQDNIRIIEGGTAAGRNLFHSFQQFSVPTGSTAYFNNAPEIENIISRVTGSSISNIDGLIQANGKANLFVINPNGIVFGQGAQLKIGGSFFASTASSVNFANGIKFSANGSQTTPLLTISTPLGLQFGGTADGITVQGSSLAVESGKTLALVGGDVRLDGGFLQAQNGRVELGAIAAGGTVGLNLTGNNWSLSFPDHMQRADVSLTNAAKVDVTDRGVGSVAVNARNIDILGGSRISAGIGQGLTTVGSLPGDITLNATGVVTIKQLSRVTNVVAADAVGNAGNIYIQGSEINIDNRASDPTYSDSFIPSALDTGSVGQGRAGNISLSTIGSITLIGQDVDSNDQVISTFSNTQGLYGGDITLKANGSISLSNAYLKAARGNGGNIFLDGNDSVSIADNSFLNAGTIQGNSGNITIQSNGPVTIKRSYLGNNVGIGDQAGNASDINISGRSVSITDGTLIESRSEMDGRNSGTIRINATDQVEISGLDPFYYTNSPGADRPVQGYNYTTLTTATQSGSLGHAGDIIVNTPTLRVSDGASLRAESQDAFSGGNINVNANIVDLIRGGELVTNTSNRGDAGNINLNVTDHIVIDGSNPSLDTFDSASGIFANTYGGPTSRGGNLTINTGRLVVQNGAQVSASTADLGQGGTLSVNARQSVTLTGSGSSLSADSQGAGTAGNLTINTGQLQVLDGATVTASAPDGQAGNLEVTSRSIRLQNQGQLIAITGAGEKGGNITLQDFDLLLMRDRSLISAEARNNANGGNITIRAKRGFIVAVPLENSDITANALNGQGGTITIDTAGIFGMTVRSRSDLVQLLQTTDITQLDPGKLLTNDITAISLKSSTLSGQVTINTPDIDPSRGLVLLPTNLVDATQQITTSCNSHNRQRESSFVATGHGGMPPSPTEPLMSDTVLTPWVTLPNSSPTYEHKSFVASRKTTNTVNPQSNEIVEAQGWVLNANGDVVLVARAPIVTPHGFWQTPANCNAVDNPLRKTMIDP